MNDARMTIRLPGESLLFAQRYAKDMHISLSELVHRYFNRLKDAFATSESNVPESVAGVVGLIPPDVNVEKMYQEHLAEKYL